MKHLPHLEPLIASGERPEPWDQTFTLAASDLTFLWQECQRCFRLKVLMNIRQLTTIPSAFTQRPTSTNPGLADTIRSTTQAVAMTA